MYHCAEQGDGNVEVASDMRCGFEPENSFFGMLHDNFTALNAVTRIRGPGVRSGTDTALASGISHS